MDQMPEKSPEKSPEQPAANYVTPMSHQPQYDYPPFSFIKFVHTPSVLSFFFFVLLAGLMFFRLGEVGLFDVDEAVFAQATVEMRANADYVKPTYNGEPRYQKPPMIYWLQAASMSAFGETPFAARFPSALLALATVWMFYSCLFAFSGHRQYALFAAAILGFSLSFLAVARAAVADVLLLFFIISATFCFLKALYATEPKTMPLVVAGFLLAGGFLAKGPIALLVPAVVVGVVVLLRGHVWQGVLRLNLALVFGCFLLGLVPWCWAIFKATGLDFFARFILFENWERFAGGLTNSHSSSPFYYLVVLLVGFFPWSFFLPSAFTNLARSFVPRLRGYHLGEALPAVGAVWMLAVLLFFSFSATKLAHYLVPALPGAAMLLAWRFNQVVNRPFFSLHWLVTMVAALVFAGLLVGLPFLPQALLGQGVLAGPVGGLMQIFGGTWPVEKPQLIEILSQPVMVSLAPVCAAVVLLLGLGFGLSLAIKGYRQGMAVVAVSMWMVLLLVVVGVVPVVYELTQRPLATISEQVKAQYLQGDAFYMVKAHQPSVRFLSGLPFQTIHGLEQLNDIFPPQNRTAFFVTKSHYAAEVQSRIKANKINESCQGGWCLLVAQ